MLFEVKEYSYTVGDFVTNCNYFGETSQKCLTLLILQPYFWERKEKNNLWHNKI